MSQFVMHPDQRIQILRETRGIYPNRRRESRPFTKIQLLFHWRRNKRLCRRALLRNGQCIGLDPAITLRPNIMNAIRVPLSPASILWAERLWWFSQQYFEFHRCLHSVSHHGNYGGIDRPLPHFSQ